MLSVGSGPPRFSPSQNIRVIWSLPSYGNVHYRRRTLDSLSIDGGRRPLQQDRIPAVEDEPLHGRCAGAARVRSRPTGYRRDKRARARSRADGLIWIPLLWRHIHTHRIPLAKRRACNEPQRKALARSPSVSRESKRCRTRHFRLSEGSNRVQTGRSFGAAGSYPCVCIPFGAMRIFGIGTITDAIAGTPQHVLAAGAQITSTVVTARAIASRPLR